MRRSRRRGNRCRVLAASEASPRPRRGRSRQSTERAAKRSAAFLPAGQVRPSPGGSFAGGIGDAFTRRFIRSSAAGLYVAFYYLGGCFGSVLPGIFWKQAGWTGCVALIVAMQAVTAAVAYKLWKD